MVVSLNTKLERTVQQAEVYIPNSRQVSLDTGSNTRLEIILVTAQKLSFFLALWWVSNQAQLYLNGK